MTAALSHDTRESVNYDSWENTLYIRNALLSQYAPSLMGLCHWHDDLEFVYLEQGHMDVNIDGEHLLLEEHEGIFINARHLHFVYSADGSDCRMITILLNPTLLQTSVQIDRKYIQPLISDEDCSFLLLREDDDTAPLIAMIKDVNQTYQKMADGYELALNSLFFQMWLFLHRIHPTNGSALSGYQQDLHLLKKMLSYIDGHFAENGVSLHDIAHAGGISKSKCYDLFHRFIGMTPNACLIQRRLRRGQELLTETDLTIGQIAQQTGFSGSSYFSERFRQHFHCTPKEYRMTAGQAEKTAGNNAIPTNR